MADRLTLPRPTRRARPRQTQAERDACYAYVTARDETCRAPAIYWAPGIDNTNPQENGAWEIECYGPLERHHAGNTIGSAKKTDARHVVLLCAYHHANWAPTHSRLILEWLARVEDARERARHDAEEDARTGA